MRDNKSDDDEDSDESDSDGEDSLAALAREINSGSPMTSRPQVSMAASGRILRSAAATQARATQSNHGAATLSPAKLALARETSVAEQFPSPNTRAAQEREKRDRAARDAPYIPPVGTRAHQVLASQGITTRVLRPR